MPEEGHSRAQPFRRVVLPDRARTFGPNTGRRPPPSSPASPPRRPTHHPAAKPTTPPLYLARHYPTDPSPPSRYPQSPYQRHLCYPFHRPTLLAPHRLSPAQPHQTASSAGSRRWGTGQTTHHQPPPDSQPTHHFATGTSVTDGPNPLPPSHHHSWQAAPQRHHNCLFSRKR